MVKPFLIINQSGGNSEFMIFQMVSVTLDFFQIIVLVKLPKMSLDLVEKSRKTK